MQTDYEYYMKFLPDDFEHLVYETSSKILENRNVKCEIQYAQGSHTFPDIVYSSEDGSSYGIEVKSIRSKGGRWTTNGNSVLASTSKITDETYIVFFKITPNDVLVRGKRYEDSVKEVVVTHSPRYSIDLDIPQEQSFFRESGIDYDTIKNSSDPIKEITDHYKSKGYKAWWLSDSTPAAVKSWRDLSTKEQDHLIVHAFAYFPEIFGKGQNKYQKLSQWLVTEHSIADASLRDRFSAGGKVTITIKGERFIDIPRVFGNLSKYSPSVKLAIKNSESDFLKEIWGINEVSDLKDQKLHLWINLVMESQLYLPSSEQIKIRNLLEKLFIK
jgi:hypothetical protein